VFHYEFIVKMAMYDFTKQIPDSKVDRIRFIRMVLGGLSAYVNVPCYCIFMNVAVKPVSLVLFTQYKPIFFFRYNVDAICDKYEETPYGQVLSHTNHVKV